MSLVLRRVLLSPRDLHTPPAASVSQSPVKVTERVRAANDQTSARALAMLKQETHHRCGRLAWLRHPQAPTLPPPAPGSACKPFSRALAGWISTNVLAVIPKSRLFLEQLFVSSMRFKSPLEALW